MSLILKSVDAAQGPRWVRDAFRLFMRKPVAFTFLFVLFLVAGVVVSIVPLLGTLLQFMSLPLLCLGFMIAGQSALLGGPVHPKQFIEPLRGDDKKRRALLILCVVYGVSALLCLLLADGVSHNAWSRLQLLMAKADTPQADIVGLLSEPGVSAGLLIFFGGGAALSVPFWHAPALVHWGGQGVSQALFSSSLAIWRSKAAFFTYVLAWLGVVFLVAVTTAFVLGMLGLQNLVGLAGVPMGLMFSAVFYLSVLFTFNDSFGNGPAIEAPAP
jgi:hypothetical protein